MAGSKQPAGGSGVDLTGRVAIVTGAGSGIGRAVARSILGAGGAVLCVGRRADPLRETVGPAAAEPDAAILAADLRVPDTAQRVVEAALERWDRLDIVINNAGATRLMPVAETTADGIAAIFDLNVVAPSLLTRAAAPSLRRSAGSIVNVSSTYGQRPMPGAAHYAASKAALEQLTRSWALELAPDVRVNAVAPGPTESDALAAAGLPEAMIEEIKRTEEAGIPLGRRGEPDDVAAWILRMVDPRSTWLTGQVLGVDGGLSLT